ncbi:hypothetical protein M422DRAFT_52031 [Sphaerobolus stellatus SS14]|uniref:Unplaced genomic scaffold SPHSTscaffold_125, whole genome shotgun sequence n=1 Tax=Sphaerobolus stellatus (strain SS14) TaxID=990650 RepID=A0A0C9VAE3_SPHS4|nr:hypothetical protein M422DRAFT_52031 [Sphaerobolus stellatus SS14]
MPRKGNVAASKVKNRSSHDAVDPSQIIESTRKHTASAKAQQCVAEPPKSKPAAVLPIITEVTEASQVMTEMSEPDSDPELQAKITEITEKTKTKDKGCQILAGMVSFISNVNAEEFQFEEDKDKDEGEDKGEDEDEDEDEDERDGCESEGEVEPKVAKPKITKPVAQMKAIKLKPKRGPGSPPKNIAAVILANHLVEKVIFRIPESSGDVTLYHVAEVTGDTPLVDVIEIIFKKASALACVKTKRPAIIYRLSKDKLSEKFGLNTEEQWRVLLKQYETEIEKKKTNAYAEISFNPVTILEDLQALLKPSAKIARKLKADSHQLQVNYLTEDLDGDGNDDEGRGRDAATDINPVTKMPNPSSSYLCNCQVCGPNVRCDISKKLGLDGKAQLKEIGFLDFQLWVHELCQKLLLVTVDVPPHLPQFQDFFQNWDGPQAEHCTNAKLDIHPEVIQNVVLNVITDVPGSGSGPLPITFNLNLSGDHMHPMNFGTPENIYRRAKLLTAQILMSPIISPTLLSTPTIVQWLDALEEAKCSHLTAEQWTQLHMKFENQGSLNMTLEEVAMFPQEDIIAGYNLNMGEHMVVLKYLTIAGVQLGFELRTTKKQGH